RTARRPSRLLHGAGWAGAGAADVLVLDVEYASSVCATKDRDPEYEDRPGLDQHAQGAESPVVINDGDHRARRTLLREVGLERGDLRAQRGNAGFTRRGVVSIHHSPILSCACTAQPCSRWRLTARRAASRSITSS